MATPMPFLRPMAPPRASTLRHFIRTLSTASTRPRAKRSRPEDRNVTASRTAEPSYPPSSMRSNIRPKDPHASQRASLPPNKNRSYPTRALNAYELEEKKRSAMPLIPEPVPFLEDESACAPNLPYFVSRTQFGELPIYQKRKRGGDQLLTLVRKIDGNVTVLRDQLRESLGLKVEEAVINPVTRHIHLKGHHKNGVSRYLWERKF